MYNVFNHKYWEKVLGTVCSPNMELLKIQTFPWHYKLLRFYPGFMAEPEVFRKEVNKT